MIEDCQECGRLADQLNDKADRLDREIQTSTGLLNEALRYREELRRIKVAMNSQLATTLEVIGILERSLGDE